MTECDIFTGRTALAARGVFLLSMLAALIGATLAPTLDAHMAVSFVRAFFIIVVVLAGCAIEGVMTMDELLKLGTFFRAGFCILLVVLIANIFYRAPAMGYAESAIGFLLFVRLFVLDIRTKKLPG